MAGRIKRDDQVVVRSGRDKGTRGRVLRVYRESEQVVVEGINRVKRHQSAQRFREPGIVEKEKPIHASKVMLIDPKTDEPTRVRFGENKDGKKVRIAVKSGSVIDG